MTPEKIEDIEIQLLIEAIHKRYGYDFRQYAKASLKRRIRAGLACSGLGSISDMIPGIIHNQMFFENVFLKLSINVTEMFRNPPFYACLRQKIIPYLNTWPFCKIWVAGCATGEEVYSLAILLNEEGLAGKYLIYATDFNDYVLAKAKEGIYSIENIKKYTLNYQKSGGRESFGDYYHADDTSVIINRSLKKDIVFANHNLVTDDSFGEMNLILCRNVLIYFNQQLQDHVLLLFEKSLCHNGFLCLGSKETIKFSSVADKFRAFCEDVRIYQKWNRDR